MEEEESGGSGKPTGEEREEAMAVRYVIRTVDEDWIDLADEPLRIDDRRAAWAEAQRRVATDPDLKTVVLGRDTGAILWQSDPACIHHRQGDNGASAGDARLHGLRLADPPVRLRPRRRPLPCE